MVNAEIVEIIKKFVEVLTHHGIRIEKVILYGSYASGKATTDSDIDLAIVSPDFDKDRHEALRKLLQLAWRVDPRIEAVPISSALYNDTWIPLIYEIRYKGIELKVA